MDLQTTTLDVNDLDSSLEPIPEEIPTISKKKHRVGSMRQVWNGTAEMTSGRLRKSDLMQNKNGKIISIKKHEQAKRLVTEGKLKPFS